VFKAFAAALDVAMHYEADLHMLSVGELSAFPATIEEIKGETEGAGHRFAQAVNRAGTLARLRGVSLQHHIVVGPVIPTIIDFVGERDFDIWYWATWAFRVLQPHHRRHDGPSGEAGALHRHGRQITPIRCQRWLDSRSEERFHH
jgi:hypothetical protein